MRHGRVAQWWCRCLGHELCLAVNSGRITWWLWRPRLSGLASRPNRSGVSLALQATEQEAPAAEGAEGGEEASDDHEEAEEEEAKPEIVVRSLGGGPDLDFTTTLEAPLASLLCSCR